MASWRAVWRSWVWEQSNRSPTTGRRKVVSRIVGWSLSGNSDATETARLSRVDQIQPIAPRSQQGLPDMHVPLGLARCIRIRFPAFMALACAATMIAPAGQSALADESQVQVEWTVPAPQLADVQERLALPAQPVPSKDDTRGPPLFYLLAGAAALPSIVDAI